MKKVVQVIFKYDDGTADQIEDARAAMVFQSRCNSSGIFAGMYDVIVPLTEEINTEETNA